MSKKKNIVYSTNPNYTYDDDNEEQETLAPKDKN